MTENKETNSQQLNFISGEVLVFDKPLDWSSFKLVGRVRYLLCKKLKVKKLKVGHAGTLDPRATGVLILCTGKATKTIESIQGTKKEYIATIKLGATTPTFDTESEEDNHFPTEHIDIDLIESTLDQFRGSISQTPPVFSAVKIDGKRAYEYARKGEDVQIKSRVVDITNNEILSFENNILVLKVECTKGTYIRSLANDIGKALNSGGYLTDLCRTKVGEYTIENALSIDKFEEQLQLMEI